MSNRKQAQWAARELAIMLESVAMILQTDQALPRDIVTQVRFAMVELTGMLAAVAAADFFRRGLRVLR